MLIIHPLHGQVNSMKSQIVRLLKCHNYKSSRRAGRLEISSCTYHLNALFERISPHLLANFAYGMSPTVVYCWMVWLLSWFIVRKKMGDDRDLFIVKRDLSVYCRHVYMVSRRPDRRYSSTLLRAWLNLNKRALSIAFSVCADAARRMNWPRDCKPFNARLMFMPATRWRHCTPYINVYNIWVFLVRCSLIRACIQRCRRFNRMANVYFCFGNVDGSIGRSKRNVNIGVKQFSFPVNSRHCYLFAEV